MVSKRNIKRKRTTWVLLGLLTVMLIRLSSRHPGITETVYGNFVFPGVRGAFSLITSWLPIPAIALVLLYVLWLGYRTAYIPLKRRQVTWQSFIVGVLSTISALLFFFYALWGYNYSRPGIIDRLAIEPTSLDSLALAKEFETATTELSTWAESNAITISKEANQFQNETTDILAAGVMDVLKPLGYAIPAAPVGRRLKPKGVLMRFSTAGIYIPFSGEGHVDAGMLPIQIPYTMAHELGHGCGVTDEGECNFLAYLVCTRSKDPVIRFSGLLSYWRYVAFEYRRVAPDAYKTAYATLPPLVVETLKAIYENNSLYPDILPKARNAVYDTYLKSNGVEGGLVSYNRVVGWVSAYRVASSGGQEN